MIKLTNLTSSTSILITLLLSTPANASPYTPAQTIIPIPTTTLAASNIVCPTTTPFLIRHVYCPED